MGLCCVQFPGYLKFLDTIWIVGGDYWRFTDLSIRKLMESVFGEGNVEIVTFGNALAATAFLQGLAIDDLPDTSLLDKKDLDYQITIGIKATKC